VKSSHNVKHRPPKPKPGQPARVAHCREAPVKHGAYGVDVFSARAYLRAIAELIDRLAAASEAPQVGGASNAQRNLTQR
jgi:hypothetical protein